MATSVKKHEKVTSKNHNLFTNKKVVSTLNVQNFNFFHYLNDESLSNKVFGKGYYVGYKRTSVAFPSFFRKKIRNDS